MVPIVVCPPAHGATRADFIDRWAACVAVERREVIAQFSEVEETIDATQQVIAWEVIVEVE